jgi:NADH:ubiquinone oxidoreductase subunit F (NADH-binding)
MADGTRTSFFHLEGVDIGQQVCQGTACFVARHRDPARWAEAEGSAVRVHCLGRCHLAPALATDVARPFVGVDAPEAVVLGRVVQGGAPTIGAYRADEGYAALESATRMSAAALLAEVETSALRGRGGAAFPVGRKWRAVHDAPAEVKFVVCNADEGDPGAYIDRMLLEEDPHAVLEGLAIAALAVGATAGYVYVRKEYPAARAVIARAVEEARAAGILGPALLGDGPPFDVQIVDGEGSYLCGEETALLNAIEGHRPEVRARPPYPATHGLYGRPTVVNNVETLASIPWIVRRGGAAYAAMGTDDSRGTKAVSLSSLFRRPGLYEVELGVPVRHIVEDLGGGLADGELRGVLIGGPLAGVLPAHLLDTPLAFETLRRVGCEVGHGGVIAIDDHTSMLDLARHVFRFGSFESCGKCTPCREGTARIAHLLGPPGAPAPSPGDLHAGELRDLVAALLATSLCGHGTGLAAFAQSLLTHFASEVDGWLV